MRPDAKLLLGRLWAACSRLPDYGGDLWARGVERIQEKCGARVWLGRFEIGDSVACSEPTATFTVTPTGE